MTKHAKEKQARKNAEKDARRRRLTEQDILRAESDLRRQEAEINAKLQAEEESLEDKWAEWTDYYNRYTVPRLCVGFFWSALKIIRKYLTKDAARSFMDDLSEAMQEVIDKCGETNNEAFEDYKRDLEEQGYETPTWARASEWEEEQ